MSAKRQLDGMDAGNSSNKKSAVLVKKEESSDSAVPASHSDKPPELNSGGDMFVVQHCWSLSEMMWMKQQLDNMRSEEESSYRVVPANDSNKPFEFDAGGQMLVQKSPLPDFIAKQIHSAVRDGCDAATIKRWMEKYDGVATVLDDRKFSPLCYAVANSRMALLNLMIEKSGVDVNLFCNGHSQSLCKVAVIHGQIRVFERLVELGANVKQIDALGRTLLHTASTKEQVKMVLSLLKYGLDATALGNHGLTPRDMITFDKNNLSADKMLTAIALSLFLSKDRRYEAWPLLRDVHEECSWKNNFVRMINAHWDDWRRTWSSTEKENFWIKKAIGNAHVDMVRFFLRFDCFISPKNIDEVWDYAVSMQKDCIIEVMEEEMIRRKAK